jgi:hypothetical protein
MIVVVVTLAVLALFIYWVLRGGLFGGSATSVDLGGGTPTAPIEGLPSFPEEGALPTAVEPEPLDEGTAAGDEGPAGGTAVDGTAPATPGDGTPLSGTPGGAPVETDAPGSGTLPTGAATDLSSTPLPTLAAPSTLTTTSGTVAP